jgi:hypothetical protein
MNEPIASYQQIFNVRWCLVTEIRRIIPASFRQPRITVRGCARLGIQENQKLVDTRFRGYDD